MIIKDVAKNKTKTFFIVTLFFTIVTLFIYFILSFLYDDIYSILIFAFIFSFITSFISYYNSDKIVLKLNRARIATKEEYRQLNDSLEGLCIAGGMPLPKLYVMDDSSLNAFATGRNPKNAVICVTTGLMEKLDKYEMEGVLAHELSHIKNYDILLATVATVMVGFVVIISDALSRGFFRRNKRNEKDNNSIIAIIGIIFIILAPIFAKLLHLAISRNREYLADANAIEFTRNKDGLINALKKLNEDSTPVSNINKATAQLFIVNPLKKKEKDSLLSTHPNINNRITRLEKIS